MAYKMEAFLPNIQRAESSTRDNQQGPGSSQPAPVWNKDKTSLRRVITTQAPGSSADSGWSLLFNRPQHVAF